VVFTANHLTDTDKQNSTGKYRIQLKKQTMQNTAKQNYPGSVAPYDTPPGNDMGLFDNAPKKHTGSSACITTRARG